MAYETGWVQKPGILETAFHGRVSTAELDKAMRQLLVSLHYRQLYFLIDFADADEIPGKLLHLSSAAQVIHHGNTRFFAILRPATSNAEGDSTRLLINERIKIFDERDTAIAFLQKMQAHDAKQAGTG